jgi:hypothetical protein
MRLRVVICCLFYDAVSADIESIGRMIVNNSELKRSQLNRGTILEFVWRDRGELRKALVMITSDPAKIRSEKLPNTSIVLYSYTQLGTTPYSLGDKYQRFGGTCCLHLQSKTEECAESSYKTLIPTYKTTRCHIQGYRTCITDSMTGEGTDCIVNNISLHEFILHLFSVLWKHT